MPSSHNESTMDPSETSQPSDDDGKKKTEEQPKILSNRSRMTAARLFFQFHFLPFSIELAPIALNPLSRVKMAHELIWSCVPQRLMSS